jgi:hypothetical protein
MDLFNENSFKVAIYGITNIGSDITGSCTRSEYLTIAVCSAGWNLSIHSQAGNCQYQAHKDRWPNIFEGYTDPWK